MALGDRAPADKVRGGGIQLRESEQVGDGSAVKTYSVRDFLVRQTEVNRQTPERKRAIHRVQIFAVHILDQGEFS